MKKQTKSAVNAGFVQGAAILGIAGLLVKIIGAVYRIPLANIVGESGMAYYEVAYPYYSWLLVISSAGLPTAISKLVSERIALGDIVGAKRVFRAALRLLFVIGIVTAVLLFVLSSPKNGSDKNHRSQTFPVRHRQGIPLWHCRLHCSLFPSCVPTEDICRECSA